MLLDALAHCVRERVSRESLDRLCDSLEMGSKSNEDPTFELFGALTNYVYQLRDGAIHVTPDTTSLFRKAQSLLDEDSSSRRGISFDDEVANLLERIDLEASGGFDALEAGEVPGFDKPTGSESTSLRIHNTLHRLRASLEAIENSTAENYSGAPITRMVSKHRSLLDSLIPPPHANHALPLTTLEELPSLQLTFSGVELDVDEEGVVHPTYIPLLSSFLTQLANDLSIDKIRDTQVTREHDELEIQLTFHTSNTQVSALRTRAIEQGFLHADALLDEEVAIDHLLLSETARAHEPLIQSSDLFMQLQSLCAKVVVKATDETACVTTTLPANVNLEDVTVFKLNGEKYALLTESVAEIIYSTSTDNNENRPSRTNDFESYRVSRLSNSNGNNGACLLTNNNGNQIALFIDQLEPSGQLPILEPLGANTYVGGAVCLLDRRLVVLLSHDDLDDAETTMPISRESPRFRLLMLGTLSIASRLNRHVWKLSPSEGELDATAKFQEQHPHAILVEQHDLATYRNLLAHVNRLNVRVIVHCSEPRDIEVESWLDEFNLVSTLTELEALLEAIAVVNDR